MPAGIYVPITPQDGVIRSRVLSGLQFRLADLRAQPAPEVMRDDPVYADFVLPGWREDRRRAEAQAQAQARQEAEQRAAAEAQRADAQAQALRQAEQTLAQLRAQIAGQRLDP